MEAQPVRPKCGRAIRTIMEAEVFMSKLESAGWTWTNRNHRGLLSQRGDEGKSRKVGMQREEAGRNESKLGRVIVGGREQDRFKTGSTWSEHRGWRTCECVQT